MKSKKAVYFLLPVVLLLWAAIFYRIFSGSGGETAVTYSGKVQEDSYLMPEKKEYDLLLNYPDPFSGAAYKSGLSPKPAAERSPAPEHYEQPAPFQAAYDWAGVQYLGTIEHSGKSTSIALVLIQGKSYMLKKGTPQDEIKLLSLSKDSVQLQIGKEKAFVRKRNGY